MNGFVVHQLGLKKALKMISKVMLLCVVIVVVWNLFLYDVKDYSNATVMKLSSLV